MPEHTFSICAYKDSPYLEQCLKSAAWPERAGRDHSMHLHPQPLHSGLAGNTASPCSCGTAEAIYGTTGTSHMKRRDPAGHHRPPGRLLSPGIRQAGPGRLQDMAGHHRVHHGLPCGEKWKTGPARTPCSLSSVSCGCRCGPLDADRTWMKRLPLIFGNPISCPATTYHKKLPETRW